MSKQSANCPRCGYDLTGTVTTWTKQCPLTGICNECGLDVDWSRVFATSIHPWLFEYHWKRKPFSRFFLTILKAFQPGRFWREVNLTDPVHLKPASFVAAAIILLATLLLVIALAIADYQNWRNSQPWSYGVDDLAGAIGYIVKSTTKHMPGLPAVLLAMPMIFALIPTTLRKAKVKSSHILRIFSYSQIVPLVIACLWSSTYLELLAMEYHRIADRINPLHWQGHVTPSFATTLINEILPGVALVLPCTIWMSYWWYAACKHYLKLKQAGLITILLTTVLFLFAAAIDMVLT